MIPSVWAFRASAQHDAIHNNKEQKMSIIIPLNEEGFPLKVRSAIPATVVAIHVAVMAFVSVMLLLS